MKHPIKLFLLLALVTIASAAFSQKAKPVYHPCFLTDSVDARLVFIQQNAARIFTDTIDCKENLLDKIADLYIKTKDKKYLGALSAIRQNPAAKVEELYTDIVKRLIEDDFSNLLNEFYLAKGRYAPLEKELVTTLNMILGAKPLKQKYLPLLKIEIEKAKDKKDSYKTYYLEKLKTRIEEDK
ncbi:MAG TPA: hypothetical protein VK174_00810 [Chitinophagales bacterium]|nr:hypothetical protein [Chitinophagales bacterium]HLP51590.1 hypothetical protein [Chitinophagales bacterium]